MQLQRRCLQELSEVTSRTLGHAPGNDLATSLTDARFAAAEWKGEPYFASLAKTYLIAAAFLQDLVAPDTASKDERQLEMLTRQLTSALSPANFLMTNPEALALARRTNGQSLVQGFSNLVSDLTRGRISQTDTSAFEVGKNLAATPGAVVYENGLIELIQYAPSTDLVDERPLLIVPPCINRFYVLDLTPENSFVRHALQQGRTVFMLSWRSATSETASSTWDDYLSQGVLKAAEVACDICGTAQVDALGFCIGGTLLTCAAAVAAGRGTQVFSSLTLLTTLLDFAEAGDLGAMVDERTVAAREISIGSGGLLYGEELAGVFSALRSDDLVWPYVVGNYLKGQRPAAFDILFWNADPTDLPGPMVCWYLRNAYLENRIRKPAGTVQAGVAVDLSELTMPVYVLAARDDHIVPWHSAFEAIRLLGGETRFVLAASGHIAGVINPPSRNRRSYWSGGTQGIGPRTWLRTSEQKPGSWWPDWGAWLARHRSKLIPARHDLGSPTFPPTSAAPGRYVRIPALRRSGP